MEVNGDSFEVEQRRTMQGETIPPVQAEFDGDGVEEPVFLQAEEEITVHRSVQAMRGESDPHSRRTGTITSRGSGLG